MNRIITLITDFGAEEHYAGTMKGAILSVCQEVTIVDISHGIRPHSILEGALALKGAYEYFPPHTIHVAVVDPGVGSKRRGILVVTEKYSFVGPDNGILGLVMEEVESWTCVELTARHYFRQEVSPTFHGRDIFGPVAGWLAKGINYRHLGEVIKNPVRLALAKAVCADGKIEGTVMLIDRFGNLITNITKEDLARTLPGTSSVCLLEGKGTAIPLKTFYGEVPPGEACAVVGGGGFVEISINQGRASDKYGVRAGHRIRIIKG